MKNVLIIAVCLLSVVLKSQSCDSLYQNINYSTSSHAFCVPGTYNSQGNNFNWVRITATGGSNYFFSQNGSVNIFTNSIIFIPTEQGLTNFVLTGSVINGTLICQQSISWTFTTIVCDKSTLLTSIEKYNLHDLENEVIYFDLNGNRTYPKSGVLMIQQIGNYRKKIVFE